MKIQIRANELVDGEIDYISLVKHGANRTPFAIVKNEQQPNLWAGLMPELDLLADRLNNVTESSEQPTMKQQNTPSQVSKAEQREARVDELRSRLNTLNDQLLRLWESPQHPLFNRLDSDLTMSIEKTELELAGLRDDSAEMNRRSSWFRRGGRSVSMQASMPESDSANERGSAVQKAEDQIDLRDNGFTTTDPDEVAKIDLDSGFKI